MSDRGMAPDRSIMVIDLGVLDRDAAPALDFPGGLEDPGTTPRPSPWLVVLLLAAFCLAGLTAAGEPAAPPRLVLSAEGALDPPRLAGDQLLAYVEGLDGPTVTTYALRDGTVRWSHRPARRAALTPAAPVVLLAPAACQSLSTFVTDAVDATTGRVRWRQSGAPIWLVAGAALAVFKQPVRGCVEASVGFDQRPSAAFQWVGVDLSTGEVRWSVRIPAGVTLTAGTDSVGRARWLAVTENGTVTAYDLRTGQVAGTTALPGRVTPGQVSAFAARAFGAGDRLLIVQRAAGTLAVSGFTAPDLTARWQTVISAPRDGTRTGLEDFVARWCGPTVCLGPPTETVGLDSLTGQERWRVPGRPLRIGPRFALFVRTSANPGRPLLAVQDLQTGRVRVALDDGQLLGRLENAALLSTPTPGGSRLWRLELGSGSLRPVTTLTSRYVECDAAGRYLSCRSTDGTLQVWRMPARCAPVCGAVPPSEESRRAWPRS